MGIFYSKIIFPAGFTLPGKEEKFMNFVEEFLKKCRETTRSFQITKTKRNGTSEIYHFMQDEVGSARYIYGLSHFDEADFAFSNKKFRLVAIATSEELYLYDALFFVKASSTSLETLPKKVYPIEKLYENYKSFVENKVSEFWDSLPVNEVTDIHDLKRAQEYSRDELLLGRSHFSLNFSAFYFKEADIKKALCGFINLEEKLKANLEFHKDKVIWGKSLAEVVNKYVTEHTYVEDWEMEIAQKLNSINNGKTVSVTFKCGAETGTWEMDISTLMFRLCHCTCFAFWDFCDSQKSKEFLQLLNASKEVIDFQNVIKIKHNNKVLFER